MTDELKAIADKIKAAGEKVWASGGAPADVVAWQRLTVPVTIFPFIDALEKAEEYIDEHVNSSEWVKQIRELEAQLAAAREALRVFAERRNWRERSYTWDDPEKPWTLAQKALEGK